VIERIHERRDEPPPAGGPANTTLPPDDVLAQAIERLPEAEPSRDLWPAVRAQIERHGRPEPARRTVTFTLPQLALAASLLMAVTAGVAWLASNRPGVSGGGAASAVAARETPVQAQVESTEPADVVPANFADAQFDAAVADLERILREEGHALDPRTVMVIERNLKAIDDAIRDARAALDKDPANPYLNSHLADARRRKLDLLRRATYLTTTGGD
jgi:hypothetical protein